MSWIAAGVIAFAAIGFVLGRIFASKMDIGGEGLRRVYICFGTASTSAIVGLAIMLVAVHS